MPCSFVPVNERVLGHGFKTQNSGLFGNCWVLLLPKIHGLRRGNGGFDTCFISHPVTSSRIYNRVFVDLENVFARQIKDSHASRL